jgi:hypothetical protein
MASDCLRRAAGFPANCKCDLARAKRIPYELI